MMLLNLVFLASSSIIFCSCLELAKAINNSQTTLPQETEPYVNVEWRRSEQDQTGKHSCTSKKRDGHSEEVVCTTQIKFRQNNLEDLLDEIKAMRFKLDLLESKYENFQNEIKEIKSETSQFKQLQVNLTAIAGSVSKQGETVSDIKEKLENITANVDTISSSLASIRTEDGVVYCEGSNEFRLNTSEVLYNRVKYVRVSFKVPFSKTPQVFGSMKAVDASKNTNFRYNFQVRNIDTTGFTVACMTWADTVLQGIEYQWRATTPFN